MTQVPPISLSGPAGAASVGVMIATYNRAENLMRCLKHLETQTCKDFEVLVLVDGSTDETVERLKRYQTTTPFPVRFVYQPNGGLARARNQALAHIQSPVCLMIGDDIFATPELVAKHLAFHCGHPEQEAAAVGFTRWSETGQTVTPFMRWLDTGGAQFAFAELLAGVTPGWRHFYSCNLSLKTAYLQAHPSYEGFAQYGFEDIELGYRLAMHHDLKLSFLRDAVADHLHPATFRGTCRRALQVGASLYTFGQLWPEHRSLPPGGRLKRLLLPLLQQGQMLSAITWLTDVLTRFWCPNPLLSPTLLLYQRKGYTEAESQADIKLAPAGIDPHG